MASQEDVLAGLDPELGIEAVDLRVVGVNEYAFPARHMREILASLIGRGFVVLGGDLWKVEEPRSYRPGHDNWFVNRLEGESQEAMVGRTLRAAEGFIERNEHDDDALVTFVVGR